MVLKRSVYDYIYSGDWHAKLADVEWFRRSARSKLVDDFLLGRAGLERDGCSWLVRRSVSSLTLIQYPASCLAYILLWHDQRHFCAPNIHLTAGYLRRVLSTSKDFYETCIRIRNWCIPRSFYPLEYHVSLNVLAGYFVPRAKTKRDVCINPPKAYCHVTRHVTS